MEQHGRKLEKETRKPRWIKIKFSLPRNNSPNTEWEMLWAVSEKVGAGEVNYFHNKTNPHSTAYNDAFIKVSIVRKKGR